MSNSVSGSDVASDHRHVIHSEYHLVSHSKQRFKQATHVDLTAVIIHLIICRHICFTSQIEM